MKNQYVCVRRCDLIRIKHLKQKEWMIVASELISVIKMSHEILPQRVRKQGERSYLRHTIYFGAMR